MSIWMFWLLHLFLVSNCSLPYYGVTTFSETTSLMVRECYIKFVGTDFQFDALSNVVSYVLLSYMSGTVYNNYIQQLEKMNVMVNLYLLISVECNLWENIRHYSERSSFNRHQDSHNNSCQSWNEVAHGGYWKLWRLVIV